MVWSCYKQDFEFSKHICVTCISMHIFIVPKSAKHKLKVKILPKRANLKKKKRFKQNFENKNLTLDGGLLRGRGHHNLLLLLHNDDVTDLYFRSLTSLGLVVCSFITSQQLKIYRII